MRIFHIIRYAIGTRLFSRCAYSTNCICCFIYRLSCVELSTVTSPVDAMLHPLFTGDLFLLYPARPVNSCGPVYALHQHCVGRLKHTSSHRYTNHLPPLQFMGRDSKPKACGIGLKCAILAMQCRATGVFAQKATHRD
jgi:hypothetical protein